MKAKITLFIASILLCFFVYPSAFIYPKDTLPDNNDTRLLAYIIGQVQQNILTWQPLYQGHFFAPDKNTLTYSDLFLTTSVITLPIHLFTSNPIFIFNFAFILNFTLTAFFAFIYFNYYLKDRHLSSLTTLLFLLSGFHLHYYAHMQIFTFWIFFAALLNLQKFITTQHQKYLNYFLIFTTLQLAESIFTSYLLFFASFFLSFPRMTKLIPWRAVSLCIFPTIWILLLLSYAKLHFNFPEATRPIRDAAHFSLGLDELFTKYHSWTTILLLLTSGFGSISAFFEAIFCKVRRAWSPAKTGVYALQTRKFSRRENLSVVTKRMQMRTANGWNIIFIFAIIMSLGPVLKIFGQNIRFFSWPIPLPYAAFYYSFPGFNGFRTPSRFIVLALVAACLIIGQNLKPFFKLLNSKTKSIIILLIFCLLSLESKLPLTGYPVNINLPSVYEQVKLLPKNAIILELPIKLWNMPDHEIESVRSLYSLEHKHSRFGGYSGFATLSWIDLVEQINAYGLTPEIIQHLKSLGVTHIIENNTIFLL